MTSPPDPRQIVVRCRGGGHRVRLAPGRFWAAARCGACGTHVDPTRFGRVGRWLLNAFRPAASRPIPLGLWAAVVGYLVVALVSAACLWLLADRWWAATVLLFGPRWVLILPLAVLLPAVALLDRPLIVPLALAALVVLGPVVGLRTGWRQLLVPPDPTRDIRVMSFNTEGGRGLAWAPAQVLEALEVDVAAFQECRQDLADAIAALGGWHTDARDGACLASRFPIISVAQMDRSAFVAARGGGLVVTYRLDVGAREVRVTNIHLETPREGLELLLSGRVAEAAPTLEGSSLLRTFEHRFAQRWVDTLPAPRLVLGDFNSPPESPMFRDHWDDWQNAFSRLGRGLGGTRMNGWIRARIDHILADTAWTVVRSSLGPDLGSDHLPILADLRLR